MEQESHRLDREQLLADRRVASERVQQETDDVVETAVTARRAFQEWCIDRLRNEAQNAVDRERLWVDLRLASLPLKATGRTQPFSAQQQDGWREELDVDAASLTWAAAG